MYMYVYIYICIRYGCSILTSISSAESRSRRVACLVMRAAIHICVYVYICIYISKCVP